MPSARVRQSWWQKIGKQKVGEKEEKYDVHTTTKTPKTPFGIKKPKRIKEIESQYEKFMAGTME